MPEETVIRTPSAQVRNPLGLTSPAYVHVSIPVNGDVTVDYSAYSGKQAAEGANRVMDSEIAATMGRAQQASFATRTSADSGLTINDGAGGTLEIEGFLTGPSYTLHRGNVRPTLRISGSGALLEHLKLDIYVGRLGDEGGEEDSQPLQGAAEQATGDNLADRLRSLTEKMIRVWEANRQLENDPASSALMDNRHSLNNQGPLALWYRLLSNSTGNLEDLPWLDKLSRSEAYNAQFNERVLSIMRSKALGFSQVMASLAAGFQLFSIPGRDGSVGELRLLRDQVQGEEKTLRLSSSALMLNGAQPQGLFPVKQVIMRGVASNPFHPTDRDAAPAVGNHDGQILGAFPTGAAVAGGDVLMVEPPFHMADVLPIFDTRPPRATSKEDPAKLSSSLQRIGTLVNQFQDEVVRAMVEDYCRTVYIDRSLGGTGASYSVPLDLSLWPGDRYRVTAADGSVLFTGFLAGVDHTLARNSGGGEASTNLTFTHMMFPGFNLPGI